jgi:hypothetical protein
LKLLWPPNYPETALEFELICPTLTRSEKNSIIERLESVATSRVGEVVSFELFQAAQEILSEIHASEQQEAEFKVPMPTAVHVCIPNILGRRAIYFHHIIATNKRRVVIDWARELKLGGYSKIGWPGVVIVEGLELFCHEYVRRLQHLRWKQMVVRGEQTEEQGERRLPLQFQELTDMSDLAARCQEAGVSELFLTTMKIYNR